VNAGVIYDLGQYLPTMKGMLNIGYSHYLFPDSSNDSVMGTVGFSQDLNEIWSILFDAGVRHTWSEISVTEIVTEVEKFDSTTIITEIPIRKELNNDNWSWVAGASLNYKGEYLNGSLAYDRDITVASGLGGAAERNALTISARYRLTYELSVLLTGGYYTFKSDASDFSAYEIDQRIFSIYPSIRYEFSKNMAIEASYGYTRVHNPAGVTTDNNLSGTDAERHIALIRLYYQHPFFE
jgi:predicted porin